MDTQFWGPPGHKLLHSIAYCYSFGDSQDTLNKNIIKSFLVRLNMFCLVSIVEDRMQSI